MAEDIFENEKNNNCHNEDWPKGNKSANNNFNDKIGGSNEANAKINNNDEENPKTEAINNLSQTNADEEKELLLSRLQRVHADFANYKKRTEKNRCLDRIRHQSEIISALLPIIDHLELALCADQGNIENFVKGIENITKQLLAILGQKGLTEIPALGNPFDPSCHEAIERIENNDLPTNTITEVVQKGYMVNEEVIRPSLVKVNIGGSDNE